MGRFRMLEEILCVCYVVKVKSQGCEKKWLLFADISLDENYVRLEQVPCLHR